MAIPGKVPPTRRALSMIHPIPGRITGRTRPTAITTCPRLHRRRLPSDLDSPTAANVDAAAVTPNTGHAHPNTDGSSIAARHDGKKRRGNDVAEAERAIARDQQHGVGVAAAGARASARPRPDGASGEAPPHDGGP